MAVISDALIASGMTSLKKIAEFYKNIISENFCTTLMVINLLYNFVIHPTECAIKTAYKVHI